MEYELALILFQYIDGIPEGKRPKLMGHWRLNSQKKTVSLVMLTIGQVTMLDVMMCSRLRAVSDLVECLDFALEQAVR